MKRKFGLLVAVMAMLASVTTTAYAETQVNLPDGAALTIDIEVPTSGTIFETGETIEVTGTASVGQGSAVKDTDVVFVLDTSGSTGPDFPSLSDSGTTCDTDPTNNLSTGNDFILTCEKEAVLDLIEQAAEPASRVANAGITNFPFPVPFGLESVSGGTAPFIDPLNALTAGGGTDFEIGIDSALGLLATSDESITTKAIILLTDGDGSSDPANGEIDAIVLAFTIAGAGCTTISDGLEPDGEVVTEDIIERALEGSSCTQIPNLGALANVIQGTFTETRVGTSLDSIAVTADDGESVVTLDVVANLPVVGPGSTTFTAETSDLGAGSYEICATATGSDQSSQGASATTPKDCVDVTVEDPLPPGTVVVDCAGAEGTCEATATDDGVATLEFEAPAAFDEEVVIVPTTDDCPVASCRTGFDVTFEDENTKGDPDRIVTLTVTTENRVRFRDRLRAAVFIDGERIRAQCNNRFLVRALRDRWGRPEPLPCITIRYVRGLRLEYFVKFDADPRFRFR